jgi:hypothetical protein
MFFFTEKLEKKKKVADVSKFFNLCDEIIAVPFISSLCAARVTILERHWRHQFDKIKLWSGWSFFVRTPSDL